MKSGYLLTVLIALLLVGDGCTKTDVACGELQQSSEVATKEIEAEKENSATSETDSKITPYDEAKCMASAKKWVKEAEKLATEIGGNAPGNLNLAMLLAKTGDRKAAIKIFDRAIKDAPSVQPLKGERDAYGHALREIAEAQAKAGLYDLAEKTARSIKGKYHRDYAIGSIMLVAIKVGDFEVAKRLYPDGHMFIAIAEAEAGKFDDAKKTAELMLKHDMSQTGRAFAQIALLEAKAGKVDAAKKTLAKAKEKPIASNPTYFYAEIAKVEAEMGLTDSAVKTLEKIKSDSYRFPVLLAIASAMVESGDKKSAAKLINEAKSIVSNPETSSRLCEVAIVEAKAVGKEAALKTFEQAWQIDRNREHRWQYGQIVEAIARAGLYSEAKKYAMKWQHGESSAMMSIAVIQAEAGLYDDAEKTAAKSIELGKNVKGFRLSMDSFRGRMARIQAYKGEFKQAYETLKSIDNPTLCDIAEVIKHSFDAGETQYIKYLITRIEPRTSQPNREYLYLLISDFLARAGYDSDVDAKYKAMNKSSGTERLNFCLGAARGYLKRIEDKKAKK